MDRIDLDFAAGSDTLVLNKDGAPVNVLPISTIKWRDAIKAVYISAVEPIAYYDNWVVRSQSLELPVPSIVMTKNYIKPGRLMKFSRSNVFLRDNHICQYCGAWFSYDDLTMDHVVPRADGGKTVWENIVSACGPCNSSKGHGRHMKPKTKPYKPAYYEMAEKAKTRPIVIRDESWNTYLNWPVDKVKITYNK